MTEPDNSFFVFQDAAGKRWPRLRLFLLVGSLLLFFGMVLFARSLFITPQLQLPAAVVQLKAHLRGSQLLDKQAESRTPVPLWLRFSRTNLPQPASTATTAQLQAPLSNRVTDAREIRLGFYVNWDPASYDSLRDHADQLTHVSPEWLTIVDGEGTLVAEPDQKLLALAEKKNIVLMPIVSNLVDNEWQPEAVEGLINGPDARQEKFIATLLKHLEEAAAGGVLIDWGQVDPAYQRPLTDLINRVSAALHQKNMQLWLAIPMGLEFRTFDLEALAGVVDRFVAVLHDENSESDPPGPVASQPWFEGWLQTALGYGKPGQWIVAIGAYGYDWALDQRQAEVISFADALTRAGRAGLQDCQSRPPAYNPHFSYVATETEHTVWFLDGITFLNQVHAARRLQAGGIAIFRLGTEDPTIWRALPLAQPSLPTLSILAFLQDLDPGETTAQIGGGNFLAIDENKTMGIRKISLEADGHLATSYQKFPAYLTIVHQGQGRPEDVAISFDDGPDPEWTPAILDILRNKGVKASFFMLGDRMEEHPELVRRILREGHEIGVHTYTHPNLATVSAERARLELNATQRLIETITGRATFLFRPPYNADSQPREPEKLIPVKIAQGLGYLTVASDIDPEDWSRPGVTAIVQRIKEQRPRGNIVLLHDAGGDRSQTVAALPQIIEYLQVRGDRLVSLSQMLGAPPESLMPPLPHNQQPILRLIYDSGFRTLHIVGELGWAFMIVATVLVTLRTLVVALLAQYNRHRSLRENPASPASFQPPLSIVIAAYNEEKVIARTISSLLCTEYPGRIEVIVVDDGSTDRTAKAVARIAARDRRLRLIRQTNQGKARALCNGFQAAANEIIVTLDADTIFQKDTISHLVQPLRDEQVGAVSGHVKVGNQQTLVARFQSLEYTCGFNLDRRAYQQLNCITVVPGAASAWRHSAIMAAGGISNDTLAEDTDLTLSLHKAGYRVDYAPLAIAWTEAPQTYATLAKQRCRWAFGTLQCLWKHRDLVGNPHNKALGWFSLPSIWFFQILLVAVGPVIDAILIFSLLFGLRPALLLYLLAFLAMDLLLAGLACRMERESMLQSWRILPMRFIYRPLLAWVIWKSITRAAKGAWVGWGKFERSATMTVKTEA